MSLVRQVARWSSPVVWGSRQHAGRRFHAFALAEDGSRLDLLAAANATGDPERAAAYLRHALDEARHARMFALAAAERGTDEAVHADADGLYERLGEKEFVAFLHLGEARGVQQFEGYREYFAGREPRTAALFETILVDERRHEAYTRELLAGGLWRAQAWEAWRAWLRAGRSLSGLVWIALVMPLYLALAPLALLVRWLRPDRRGWQP